ncbi:MAG: hypothetical protein ACI83N_001960, partial [Hydrogenophaga sp.]
SPCASLVQAKPIGSDNLFSTVKKNADCPVWGIPRLG